MEYKLWALLLLIADRDGLRKHEDDFMEYFENTFENDGTEARSIFRPAR